MSDVSGVNMGFARWLEVKHPFCIKEVVIEGAEDQIKDSFQAKEISKRIKVASSHTLTKVNVNSDLTRK